jgi:hypothetical protein
MQGIYPDGNMIFKRFWYLKNWVIFWAKNVQNKCSPLNAKFYHFINFIARKNLSLQNLRNCPQQQIPVLQ